MGRDFKARPVGLLHGISIHAPRMGRDASSDENVLTVDDFNPRAPHGARLGKSVYAQNIAIFQSTRPAWGATRQRRRSCCQRGNFNPRAPHGARRIAACPVERRVRISIHAPRMGRDVSPVSEGRRRFLFQSTRPAWGATPPHS